MIRPEHSCGRLHTILIALLLALGAPGAAIGADGPGRIRLCDETGCRLVSSDHAQRDAGAVTGGAEATADADLWRGESLGDLAPAADQLDPAALYKMGQIHLFGLAGVPRNPAAARRHFAAAAERGHAWASFRLAEMVRDRTLPPDPALQARLLFAAASGGVAPAAYNVGMAYVNGTGAPQDAAEGARWLEKAANGSVAEARYALALLHMRGAGIPRQPFAALRLMREAAAGGHVPAQAALGRMYATGFDSMRQDIAQAKTWLRLASDAGDAESAKLLRSIEHEERVNLEHQRELQRQQPQMMGALMQSVVAAWLSPPPVRVIVY
ncbi:sel1 repeat family protein [Aquincola sp. S2]|uniref:Sel1 repeat family protein n=1 Tax=Pseudaquabacterium terrae TaxID=2732868 RepID=A0ABX2ERH5_9BURK|nr:tetratricopeptide repeat protein [Aquabacterium terrae]NRF71213.1 sel1 repeat family protein [Aquabacterium terrae]